MKGYNDVYMRTKQNPMMWHAHYANSKDAEKEFNRMKNIAKDYWKDHKKIDKNSFKSGDRTITLSKY